MTTATATATQVYRIHIKATPEEIWDALMKRGKEFGYHSDVEYDLEAGTYTGFANAEMREYGMPEVLIDRRDPRGRPPAPARPDLEPALRRRRSRRSRPRG